MSDQREAWDKVGDSFSTLTGRFKERYEARSGAHPDEARQKLKGAFTSIVDAVDAAATALNEMAREPETREDAKSTLLALRDALNVSFSELGDEFRDMFTSQPEPPPSDDEPGPAGS